VAEAPGTVTIRLPQALAEHADGARELTVEIDGPTSLEDILDRVRGVAPAVARRIQDETGAIRRFVNVYVDEDECRTLDGLQTTVAPGAQVFVIGSVAGGA
jgi:sulfur-carrier protein